MNTNPDATIRTAAPVPNLTQPLLGVLCSGEEVYDRLNSHLANHPVPGDLLREAFARINAEGREFLVTQIDFDRTVECTTCVSVDTNDQILFAQRREGEGLTPFVLGRVPEPASSVVVILKRFEGFYVLITAFIGTKAEPLPWNAATLEKAGDPAAAYRRAVEFWTNHALLWGSEPVIEGTETDVCPW